MWDPYILTLEYAPEPPCSDTDKLYVVSFHDEPITTTVTHDPNTVTRWISEIEHRHVCRLHCLIVGLDIEWHPNTNADRNNPVATLQLCVGSCCLIYQLMHTPDIPKSLVDFLSNENYTFVGVGINSDLQKLKDDYGLGSDAKAVDLRTLATVKYGIVGVDWKNAGLETFVRVIMGYAMDKPQWVTMSRWDELLLTKDQVTYACVDAYVLSFEIGRRLNAFAFSG